MGLRRFVDSLRGPIAFGPCYRANYLTVMALAAGRQLENAGYRQYLTQFTRLTPISFGLINP